MAKQRKRVKHTATFEERLGEEAIKFKDAAEKQPPGSTARELLLRPLQGRGSAPLRRHRSGASPERLDSPSLAIPGLTSSDRKPNLPLPWARMGLNAKCSTG
jgi:hypothetical protein